MDSRYWINPFNYMAFVMKIIWGRTKTDELCNIGEWTCLIGIGICIVLMVYIIFEVSNV